MVPPLPRHQTLGWYVPMTPPFAYCHAFFSFDHWEHFPSYFRSPLLYGLFAVLTVPLLSAQVSSCPFLPTRLSEGFGTSLGAFGDPTLPCFLNVFPRGPPSLGATRPTKSSSSWWPPPFFWRVLSVLDPPPPPSFLLFFCLLFYQKRLILGISRRQSVPAISHFIYELAEAVFNSVKQGFCCSFFFPFGIYHEVTRTYVPFFPFFFRPKPNYGAGTHF